MNAIEAGNDRIKRVVEDIADHVKATKRIDLLVITHEHYDHLSGFCEQDIWKNIQIGELWMAWTENPDDAQAQALRARFTKGKQALAKVAEAAQAMALDDSLRNALALSAFVGPPAFALAEKAKENGRPRSTRDMIEVMRAKVPPDKIRHLTPGQVLPPGQAFGFKVYVLGPPRDETYLKKDTPSAGAAKEVYLTRTDEAEVVEAMATARMTRPLPFSQDVAQNSAPLLPPSEKPFAGIHLMDRERLQTGKDLRAAVMAAYDNPADGYRKIDDVWTGAAESLALKMDSDTNNTSLALGFELPDGRVLLFPGDAQVGNWLSWRNQTYPPKPLKGQPPPKTIDDILSRVVFYKVGHHGSHNATLREFGLEKMTDPRLTAAIPVVEAVAAIQGKGKAEAGKGWAMPYGDLFTRLKARTGGRIVKGDGDMAAEIEAFAKKEGDPDKSFRVKHGPGGLWVELTCPF